MTYIVGQTAALDFGPIVDVRTGEAFTPSNVAFQARSPDGGTVIDYAYPADSELELGDDGLFHVNLPLDFAGVWEGELTWGADDEIGETGFRLYVKTDIGYRPSVADVSARLYARTLDENGNRGVFNDTTTPTADHVEQLIDDAVAIVESTVGDRRIPQAHWAAATYAVICRVAMSIERGFLPETTDENFSSYRAWLGEYNAAIEALRIGMSSDQPNVARYNSIPMVAPRALRIDPVTNELL